MMEKKKKRKKLLLFLCTGNTCRSPMAAAYLKKLVTEKKIRNAEVKTAGVMTVAGLLATPEAVQIMDAVGVDLRRHRSRKLTPELIKKADLILGMTPFHVQSALRMSPDARGKTYLLKEYTGSDARHAQISDPMGCTLEVYKRVFGEIKSACNKLLKSPFFEGKKKKKRTPARKTTRKKTIAAAQAPKKKPKKAPAKKTTTAKAKTTRAVSGKGKTTKAVSSKAKTTRKKVAAPKKSAPPKKSTSRKATVKKRSTTAKKGKKTTSRSKK